MILIGELSRKQRRHSGRVVQTFIELWESGDTPLVFGSRPRCIKYYDGTKQAEI